MGEATTVTMADFLTTLATIVTKIFGTWIPEVCSVIIAQPFLLFTVGFLAAGGVIGILGRLLSKN